LPINVTAADDKTPEHVYELLYYTASRYLSSEKDSCVQRMTYVVDI